MLEIYFIEKINEKRKNKKSNEEISNEFDLPERKSKIATMKQDGQAYCICRFSDCPHFTIDCDGCEEWRSYQHNRKGIQTH